MLLDQSESPVLKASSPPLFPLLLSDDFKFPGKQFPPLLVVTRIVQNVQNVQKKMKNVQKLTQTVTTSNRSNR